MLVVGGCAPGLRLLVIFERCLGSPCDREFDVETRCSPCYINNLFTHLERHHEQAKLDEIEAIGFGFLRCVPQWHVKQGIMLQLARAYEVDTNTLISAELIGSVFGIPSHGDPIPELQKKNPSHLAIKGEFQKKTTSQLREFVFACPMETEQQRMRFRRYFIMVVLKMFLNPTSQQTISPWHLPPILDVSNPRRFHWPYHILKWLWDTIREFQDENRKTCGGCMFVLLCLKHGLLHACRVPSNPGLLSGPLMSLIRRPTMSSHRPRNDIDESPSTKGKTSPHPRYKKQSKTGSRRKLILSRSRSRCSTKKEIPRESVSGSTTAPLVVSESDDDNHVPLARRIQLFQQHPPPHDARQEDPVFNGNHESHQEGKTDLKNGSPHTPPTAPVQLSDYNFDREFDISIIQCPEFEQVLNNVEQGHQTKAIIMQPLQTVIQWMCYSFNDTESSRFKREFYCVCPVTLESVIKNDNLERFMDSVAPIYDGLCPSFGDDTRFFDKVVAAKRKWWLYAFDVVAKRLLILDSLHYGPEDDKRIKLDGYVGRLCEDMASISIPAFVWTTHGPARSYARVPKQPNNFDCGMCVIKLMESWTEERQLCEWDEDSLRSDRMELMVDIICGPQNALVHQLISLLEHKVKLVCHNAPRNKKKDVNSPYTAPSTWSLIERAEGLSKGAMRRGRKKLLN
ncbi:uncharacterized protein DS421_5g156920 [Arachis hypogaea]|nr:uncharacterized protein DS421_5g156920 [Arachis hypogaea]